MNIVLKTVRGTSHEKRYYSQLDFSKKRLALEHSFYDIFRVQRNGIVLIVEGRFVQSSHVWGSTDSVITIIVEDGDKEYTESICLDETQSGSLEKLDLTMIEVVNAVNILLQQLKKMEDLRALLPQWDWNQGIHHTGINTNNHFFRGFWRNQKYL